MRFKIFHCSIHIYHFCAILLSLILADSTGTNGVAYSFRYSVEDAKSGVVTHHWEMSQNGKVTGGYSFLDPNGKVRVVEYVVEGNRGFRAFVTYRNPPGQFKGHLKYPTEYRKPVKLQEPVSLITADLLRPKDK